MKKYLLPSILFLAIIISGCKKDEPIKKNEPNQETKEEIIEIKTNWGNMYIWLYKETPKHRANYLKLAKENYFDGTTFHRIIPGFMIQGGDPNSKDNNPNNDGFGGPGYTIPAEFNDSITNVRGALAGASEGAKGPSSGSQFFINVVPNAFLNTNYTVYGFVMSGMNVADSIVKQKRDGNDRPFTDIKMDVNVVEKSLTEIKNEFNYEPHLQ